MGAGGGEGDIFQALKKAFTYICFLKILSTNASFNDALYCLDFSGKRGKNPVPDASCSKWWLDIGAFKKERNGWFSNLKRLFALITNSNNLSGYQNKRHPSRLQLHTLSRKVWNIVALCVVLNCVSYCIFWQLLGTAHSKRLSKSFFWHVFARFCCKNDVLDSLDPHCTKFLITRWSISHEKFRIKFK